MDLKIERLTEQEIVTLDMILSDNMTEQLTRR